MKNAGVLSILICWAGLLFLIRKWKGNVSMTFSQHAAQTKAAAVYYFFLFALTLPLFYWFLMRWFASEFHFGLLFKILVTICCAGLAVAAITPETVGKKVMIHRIGAFTMTDFMFLISIIIAFNTHVSPFARVVATFAAFYMAVAVVILWETKARHPKVLLYQAVYVVIFHVVLLTATYAR